MEEIVAGKYLIIKRLGGGAYSTVYLVRHIELGVNYALKVLNRIFSEDKKFLDRFKREAGIMLRFAHPCSVQLRDFSKTQDGLYYMATDFCHGQLLEEVLSKKKKFDLITALEIVIQVLDTLEAAHALNIVHRDIKPSNIILEEGEKHTIKVLDFGVAKLMEELPSDAKVTIEGASIGTPEYMSPEQASGEADLDYRVDIYATGILLYELLSGTVPFRGETVLQTLLKHLTQPVPPLPPELAIPDSIEIIIKRALQKERAERYQNTSLFKAECVRTLEQLRKPPPLSQKVVEQNEKPSTQAQQKITPSKSTPQGSNQTTSILCLDDNVMILEIMRHILEREGYRVFTAQNFSSIHDYLFHEKVELLLCDVNMPGLPGSKICKMLKTTIPTLKIILFSNIPERELEKLALDSKADAWLSKNLKPEEWLVKVKEVESIG